MAERPVCSLYFLGLLVGKVVVGHFQSDSQNCSESFHCSSWHLMSCSNWYNRRNLFLSKKLLPISMLTNTALSICSELAAGKEH